MKFSLLFSLLFLGICLVLILILLDDRQVICFYFGSFPWLFYFVILQELSCFNLQ